MSNGAAAIISNHLPHRPETQAAASRILQRAAALWFLTAVAGQWLFVYYISRFYGPAVASGDFAAWDRNPNLTDGYISGDLAGNLFFAAHVMTAAVLTFGGTLQLMPQIRQRAIAFHRWNGRLFMIAAIGGALAGLYLQWIRGTGIRAETGLPSAFGTTLDGLLILVFAALAWRAVRSRNIAAHRVWATRLFLVVNGTWFLRVGFRAWMVLTGGAFGAQPFFTFWSYGTYLFPLAVYELYLRARTASPRAQHAMATGLVVLTLIMGVGEVYTFLRNWRPLLSL